LLNIENE